MKQTKSHLRRIWSQHKRKIVISGLVLYFVCFVLYDAYSGMKVESHNNQPKDDLPSLNDGAFEHKKSYYETDPDRIVQLSIQQRNKETREQLEL